MGANAQTTVPLFVSGQVLTAAQQNTSAGTGVPVFATTTTRDAAFGGSNKALAEGQLCYIEASDVVQYYTGAAWATVGPTASKVAQVVSATYNTATTTTSTSFVTTGLSASITPTLNTSKVFILVSNSGYGSANTNTSNYTIFRGTVAGTNLATGTSASMAQIYSPSGDSSMPIVASFMDSPATTSATTYTFAMKSGAGTTTTHAQKDGAQATITLWEILV